MKPKITYSELIVKLQEEASQLINEENKISIFIRNIEADPQVDDVIVYNTIKRYNWLHIIYRKELCNRLPKSIKKKVLNTFRDERTTYYCDTLEDIQTIVEHFLKNPLLVTKINPDDCLEKTFYSYDDENVEAIKK